MVSKTKPRTGVAPGAGKKSKQRLRGEQSHRDIRPDISASKAPSSDEKGASPPSTVAEAALFYAGFGHTVFPAPIGTKKSHKAAEYSNGCRWGATNNPEEIRADFNKWDANIGLPTGIENKFFVVEADTLEGHDVDGIAALAALVAQHGPLPETRMARSPSGSMHYYFKNPPDIEIQNSTSKIAAGVDVRGEGGMVIAPPSVKPGKGKYEWVNWGTDIAEAPEWLIELCRKKEDVKKPNGNDAAAKLLADDPELVARGLNAIPNNDLGYDEWKNWGLAIWGATGGSDEGFAAFDRWSRKSKKKYDEPGTLEAWAQITSSPPDRIGAGSIFKAADLASPIWRDFTIEQREQIERLAALSPIQYDQQRKDAAKNLSIRVDTLDQYVFKVRPRSENDVEGQGTPVVVQPTEPWHEPVDGERLVADMEAAIKKHVVVGDELALATLLWTIHVHAFEFADHSPRLHIFSPAARCGKTTLLDIVECLVPKPLRTENVSLAVTFRIIEKAHPTLLIDEADTFLKDNEDMRGILNSGHRRGGQYLRIVGEDFEPRAFSVWSPVAIAGIGSLAPTIEDRSITIALRRRLKDEKIERLKRNRQHLLVLGRRAARWVADNGRVLDGADPELPDELGDREQDNWRPLIAIADAISEELGQRARKAALKISKDVKEDDSAAILLLADVAGIFELKKEPRLSSQQILDGLLKLEDRPWAEWRRGQPMTKTSVARLLKPFDIHPKQIKALNVKGYEAGPILEAKTRYVDNETKLEEGDVADDPI